MKEQTLDDILKKAICEFCKIHYQGCYDFTSTGKFPNACVNREQAIALTRTFHLESKPFNLKKSLED